MDSKEVVSALERRLLDLDEERSRVVAALSEVRRVVAAGVTATGGTIPERAVRHLRKTGKPVTTNGFMLALNETYGNVYSALVRLSEDDSSGVIRIGKGAWGMREWGPDGLGPP